MLTEEQARLIRVEEKVDQLLKENKRVSRWAFGNGDRKGMDIRVDRLERRAGWMGKVQMGMVVAIINAITIALIV